MTMVINGEPWFVNKDVAMMRGYSKSRNAIAMHVDEEDKRAEQIVHPFVESQRMTVINEFGLYALILSSKLPQAKEFKRWVTSEVLGYAKPENALARHVDAGNKRGGRDSRPQVKEEDKTTTLIQGTGSN